jgi:hypothetical protein
VSHVARPSWHAERAVASVLVTDAPQTPAQPSDPGARPTTPAPLLVAASVAGVEAALLVLYGIAEIAAVDAARAVMGVSTALFFLVYGAGLAYCGWAMSRGRTWARSPVVMAQLIQLGVAWSFIGGDSTPVAVTLGFAAVLVLGGIFHPASLRALAGDE